MVKVLSQSGMSLADVYDVQGSIAGIEQLESREVSLVHEMGGTIFSERISGAIRRMATAAINQDTNYEVVLSDLPNHPWRVLSVFAMESTSGRVSTCQISLFDADAIREVPLMVWAAANDLRSAIRIRDGGATGDQTALVPATGWQTPNLGIGVPQRETVNQLAMRGRTAGFGAGTVTVVGLVYIAHTHIGGGLSSRGLPLPGW